MAVAPLPPAVPAPAAAEGRHPLLRLRGITKRFGAVLANDGISLELHAGEVLALLGENGAGKSTLVSILFGHYVADAGRIEVDGHPLPPGQPRAARAAGIGMVHQHFTLADNLSVLDNVMLGTEPLWQPFSRRAAARERLRDTAARFGLAVDADARVGDLSVGERQRVEILKALTPASRRAAATRVLILDEPTAVLTPQESESLFHTLGQMVAGGLGIVFISHKLDEVLRVSHRVAVLRGGRLVAERAAAGARKEDLAALMVGREVPRAVRRAHTAGAVMLQMQGVTVHAPHSPGRAVAAARPLLDGIDLQLHAGEVLAIAGVAGNGQQVLAEVLGGGRAPDAGTCLLAGRAPGPAPTAWLRAGAARIPEDRHATGVVGDMAVWENAVLERIGTRALSRLGWVRRGRSRAMAAHIVERFDVRGTEGGGLDTVTRALSGGNMQKLILGRALTGAVPAATGDGHAAPPRGGHAPPLIVASQPTWGLDVGAVAFVHQCLLDACAQGSAVLLISEDLDEIFALADRIAVMHHGRLGAARPTGEWSLAAIGLAMAGTQPAEASHAA